MARTAPVVTSKKSPAHTVCSKGEIAQSTVQDVRLPSPGVSGSEKGAMPLGTWAKRVNIIALRAICRQGVLRRTLGIEAPRRQSRRHPPVTLIASRSSTPGGQASVLGRCRLDGVVMSGSPARASGGRFGRPVAPAARASHRRSRRRVACGRRRPRRARGSATPLSLIHIPSPRD